MPLGECQLFRKGLRDFHRARFSRAERSFQAAAQGFLAQKQFSQYFEAAAFLVRSHVERDIDQLNNVERKSCEIYEGVRRNVAELLAQKDLTAADQSRGRFVLALLALAEGDLEGAAEKLRLSLELAEKAEESSALIEPLYALAYWALKNSDEDLAFSYLQRLNAILALKENPKYTVKAQLLAAAIHLKKGEYDQGLKNAWKAYRELLQVPNFVVYIHTLNYLAQLYIGKQDLKGARHYLELAQQALVGSELRRVSSYVSQTLNSLNETRSMDGCELRYEVARGMLTNREGRTLDFAGQFVMQDLLKLFALSPGRSFSKEEIVLKVWGETYDPSLHNNKLYVTIRRLRRMLQQLDVSVPNTKLIVRSKNGYRLDPEVHLQLR